MIYREYEGVTLTSQRQTIAKQIKFRHTILVEFLEIIGMPKKITDADCLFHGT